MSQPLLFNVKEKKGKFLGRFAKYYIFLFLLLVVFIFGYAVGRTSDNKNGGGNGGILGLTEAGDDGGGTVAGDVLNQKERPDFLSKNVDFDLFWDVWDTIKGNYVDQPVAETDLLYGAMAGSVAGLGDPHSVFFDPETNSKFMEEMKGNFEGIGAEIAIKKDQLVIVAPLADSPAAKADLKSGDKILAIDGKDTAGMNLDYAVSIIRGAKGTEVVLTISRDGWEDSKEVKVVRDTIKIDSVQWRMLDNNIALLEVKYLNEDTSADFNDTVMEIVNKNPSGVILDLRNDPGGYLDTAIDIASEWVEDGVIVSEKGKGGDVITHKANGRARLKDFKTVVLINKGSASGSEIIAGALQDYKLATLVGETSFGKGSVQTMFPLDDGSAIKLTIARWYTPNENLIDGEGIDPDISIELSDEDFSNDKDPQLDKAIELLK